MAAALTAGSHGASVTLLDEQATSGGQIYRAVAHCSEEMKLVLGDDYRYGETLVTALKQSAVQQIYNATVWAIDDQGTVTYSQQQSANRINAKQIIIATGALERSYPLPGWTLPGVMTIGAAQILLKSSQLIIDQAVLVGTGPLLYTMASQLINAGSAPAAVIDTVTTNHHLNAARYFPFSQASNILKGLSYLRQITRAGVPYYKGASEIEISGDTCADLIQFKSKSKTQHIKTDNVLLHQGVIPNTQLSRSLRLKHQWHQNQHCFHPVTDEWGVSSSDNIRIAGDGSGISGAEVAEQQGILVALGAVYALGAIDSRTRDTLAAPLKRKIATFKKLREFLDTLYEPPSIALKPENNTIVCRCEEVTAGEIRSCARLGCSGPNQTKAFSRCGMGPCQGRYCGLTVTEILAAENQMSHDEVGAYRIRSPIKPVTLAELASLDQTQ